MKRWEQAGWIRLFRAGSDVLRAEAPDYFGDGSEGNKKRFCAAASKLPKRMGGIEVGGQAILG